MGNAVAPQYSGCATQGLKEGPLGRLGAPLQCADGPQLDPLHANVASPLRSHPIVTLNLPCCLMQRPPRHIREHAGAEPPENALDALCAPCLLIPHSFELPACHEASRSPLEADRCVLLPLPGVSAPRQPGPPRTLDCDAGPVDPALAVPVAALSQRCDLVPGIKGPEQSLDSRRHHPSGGERINEESGAQYRRQQDICPVCTNP